MKIYLLVHDSLRLSFLVVMSPSLWKMQLLILCIQNAMLMGIYICSWTHSFIVESPIMQMHCQVRKLLKINSASGSQQVAEHMNMG